MTNTLTVVQLLSICCISSFEDRHATIAANLPAIDASPAATGDIRTPLGKDPKLGTDIQQGWDDRGKVPIEELRSRIVGGPHGTYGGGGSVNVCRAWQLSAEYEYPDNEDAIAAEALLF